MNNDRKAAEELIEWIVSQAEGRYTAEREDMEEKQCVVLSTGLAKGYVTVYFLEYTICEYRVIDAAGNNAFYLHFELNDSEHARQLFREMEECLLKQKEDNMVHVILCCTCGLTTSYFTMNLNETAEKLNEKMDFEAVPYDQLYEKAEEKDVVLIAPQIGYQLKNAQSILSDKIVLAIPVAIYSSYNSFALIKFIKDALEEQNPEQPEMEKPSILAESSGSVLLLSVIDMEGEVQAAYRVYDGDRITLENRIIKDTYRIEDIFDIIASVLRLSGDIRTICFVSPGSFRDGRLTLEKANIYDFDFCANVEERFGIETVVVNATDAMALGYSQKERGGNETAFYFVPRGEYCGSIGMAENGTIFGSAGHMGGMQLKGITDIMCFPKNPYALARTPEGNVILAARYIAGLIAFSGCEHIAFYAKMIPDTEALINELSSIIGADNIPEVVKVDSVRDYLYDGAMYYTRNRKDR